MLGTHWLPKQFALTGASAGNALASQVKADGGLVAQDYVISVARLPGKQAPMKAEEESLPQSPAFSQLLDAAVVIHDHAIIYYVAYSEQR